MGNGGGPRCPVCGGELDSLGRTLDESGASLVDGRVVTTPAHRAAWESFREGGWLSLQLPPDLGGQGLPLVLSTACEEIFNRASAAFMMLPTPNRTAAAMLHRLADDEVRAAWVPKLADGSWGATICISEPDAGSDVGRIATRARRDAAGRWRVSGEKCWISFGDHDLTERIGHCLLARTGDAVGARGLSLFLVPDRHADGTRNGIVVRRIEEKMGLHGSPTCVLGFEGAEAILLGAEGRGLQNLFEMMLLMRLSCGPQGVGVAVAALETALGYAQERRQGGAPDAAPVPIAAHADVQRQLLEAAARVELARGASLAASVVMQLATDAPDAEDRRRWSALAQFFLPIVKDGAARCAVDVANIAIQVLGGAGYTREWPVERLARDASVFPVFEGTSGIQALDMVHRRLWRDRGEGVRLFIDHARVDAAGDDHGAVLRRALDRLERTIATFEAMQGSAWDAESGAEALLRLCEQTVGAWIATRLIRGAGDTDAARRIRAAACFALAETDARAEALAALAVLGGDRLAAFGDLVA
ncbi:acyl-CoA dehydrogenase family protein [Sphingomonas hankookensis]|uniref:acyl-CoA dehydrogenase family protein n=1 Tax=Sphingomonas hankookensis TaxID=563996 RepID=UPI003D302CF7